MLQTHKAGPILSWCARNNSVSVLDQRQTTSGIAWSLMCRGLEQSRKAEDIKREMTVLGEAGYKEVRV